MGLRDGIPSFEILSTTVSGTTGAFTNISGTETIVSSEIGSGIILNPNLSGGQVSGAPVSFEYPVSYTGSPIAGGLAMQMGSTIASDVSILVTYGKAFGGIPRVVLTAAQSGTNAGDVMVTSGITTGFRYFGQSGLAYNWIAIGSGRI